MGRGPYSGSVRKLLLSFDVGTTFSGVSYSFLEPDKIPITKSVARFPAMTQAGNDCKIPSIMYYDRHGAVQAIGAEAVTEEMKVTAEENGWTKVEWFKLHLRPKKGAMGKLDRTNIPDLRADLNVVKVFADYVKYLFDCTKAYITESARITSWESIESSIDYVFTHPNGWEGPQQSKMRQAAVKAGLISDDEKGHARISFVTEGEASLNFCVSEGFSTDAIEQGEGILVVDAGGGTIDISAYGGQKRQFEEIAPSLCEFQGSIWVTKRAEDHLKNLLQGSAFDKDIPLILERFDQGAKPVFRTDTDLQYIQFGRATDNAAHLGIRRGRLTLTGHTVASFFQPSIEYIINSIKEQRRKSKRPIKTVLLVGGFSTSDWLYTRLQDALRPDGVQIYRPNGSRNKAASEGGISFYLDRFVNKRVAKATYGTDVFEIYDPGNFIHVARQHLTRVHGTTKKRCFFDMFSPILNKGDGVEETEEFRSGYGCYATSRSVNGKISIPIIRYRGSEQRFISMKDEPELFDTLCTIEVDSSKLPVMEIEEAGSKYYRLSFEVILPFGLTELQALAAWTNPLTGAESRTAAKVVYDADDD